MEAAEKELNPEMLEKIGFAQRCYDILCDFSFVPLDQAEYEFYFDLACMAAASFGENREDDIENALSMIDSVIKISCGKETGTIRNEIGRTRYDESKTGAHL